MQSEAELGASVIAATVKDACASKSLEEQFALCVHEAKDFWMFTDEDKRFRSAVGALLIINQHDTERRERIIENMKALNALSAMISSGGMLQPDWESLDARINEVGPLPLMKMWKDAKPERTSPHAG